MKKWIVLLTMLASTSLWAQEQTIFRDLDIIGAFGGPLIEIGTINGETGAVVGGGGALVMNQLFLGGYGLGTDYPELRIGSYDYNLRLRHGGLWLGYVAKQNKVAHLYSSARIGWGKSEIRGDGPAAESDRIFVLTPEIGLELNMTSFFKLALTGGYRWVNGVTQLPGLGNDDFSSPVGTITFRFGGFSEEWE